MLVDGQPVESSFSVKVNVGLGDTQIATVSLTYKPDDINYIILQVFNTRRIGTDLRLITINETDAAKTRGKLSLN